MSQSVLDTLKKKEKKQAKAIRPMRAGERDFGWSKVKVKLLAFVVIWCEECGRKKRKEKVKEIKGKGHLGIWGREKRRSPSKWEWGQCSLKELHEWEQVKEKRKIEGVRENCERYIVRKRAVSEKKNRFFFTKIVSLNIVISI